MKNQIAGLQTEGMSELNAIRAIQSLYQCIDKHYPILHNVSKSLLIKDCLFEISTEQNSTLRIVT